MKISFKQILLDDMSGNVEKTVGRIWILMLEWKEFILKLYFLAQDPV